MATQKQSQPEKREHIIGLSETVVTFLDTTARILVYGGGFVALLAVGLLLFTLISASGAQPGFVAQNVGYAARPAVMSLLAVSIGVGWLMWGEEVAGPILVIIGLALLFAPAYVGFAVPANDIDKVKAVIDALSASGGSPVLIGLIMVVGDLAGRMRVRIQQGAKAEFMKYGQGVREERDTKNVFLGKCWQLPYCRKFVRERCPIYHSRRTCWKERVGCMCEESVIRNAMSDVKISKDAIKAATMIPRNLTLTPQQKKQRCNSCIIYNEHQKHKYKLSVPVVSGGVILLAVAFSDGATRAIQGGLRGIEKVGHDVTNLNGEPTKSTNTTELKAPGDLTTTDVTGLQGKVPYAIIIYCTLVLVLIAYGIRTVEYLIFKYKI